MRKALAILFSLSLVCAQVVATTCATAVSPPKTTCKCCDCGSTDCCVASSSSTGSVPPPATPVRAGIENQLQLSALAASALVWILPQADAPTFSSHNSSSPTAAVPLFTRHCALLI